MTLGCVTVSCTGDTQALLKKSLTRNTAKTENYEDLYGNLYWTIFFSPETLAHTVILYINDNGYTRDGYGQDGTLNANEHIPVLESPR